MSKDHVTIPKTSLMQFSKSGKFFYLDLKVKEVFSAFAKRYNAEEDYYPTDKEKYLSREIETVMGRISKQLGDFLNTSDELH